MSVSSSSEGKRFFSFFGKGKNLRRNDLIGRMVLIFFVLLGYSRNAAAPMSPRSYSAYSNAYGTSTSSYAVASPGFLNGSLLDMSIVFLSRRFWSHWAWKNFEEALIEEFFREFEFLPNSLSIVRCVIHCHSIISAMTICRPTTLRENSDIFFFLLFFQEWLI